jgi:hypothetical protein
MNRWTNQGFADEISEAEARSIGQFVSGFVVRRSKPRVVIDYTAQNEFLEMRKFRVDSLGDLAPHLKAGCRVDRGRCQRRLLPPTPKTMRQEQVTVSNFWALLQTTRLNLRSISRAMAVHQIPTTSGAGSPTSRSPHYLLSL